MSASRKRTLMKLAATAMAMVMALLAGELIMRRFSPTYRNMHSAPQPFFQKHPTRGWALIPGFAGENKWDVEVRVNNLGFRGPDMEKEKPTGAFRVLLLGDSIVMGLGLPEEVLISTTLEELLSRDRPGLAIQIINTGVVGYDIKQEKLVLEEEGLVLEPDAVILVACVNDIPGVSMAENVNPLRDLPVPCKSWLVKNSAIAIMVQGLYNRIGLEKKSWVSDRLEAGRSSETMDRIETGWKKYQEEACWIADQCRRRKIRFMLVLVPHAAQFDDQRKRFLPQHRMAKIAEECGFAFIDLAPDFASLPELPYVLPDMVHPKPKGHKIIAERIEQALLSSLPAKEN